MGGVKLSSLGWIVMLLICGFVWGGFVSLLVRAVRSERDSMQEGR